MFGPDKQVLEFKRRQRLERQRELERAQAEFLAQKEKSRAARVAEQLPSQQQQQAQGAGRPPLGTSKRSEPQGNPSLPSSPPIRRYTTSSGPPELVNTKLLPSPDSSISLSQPTPQKKEPTPIKRLTAAERKRRRLRQRSSSSSSSSESDKRHERRLTNKTTASTTMSWRTTRRRHRNESSSDDDDSEKEEKAKTTSLIAKPKASLLSYNEGSGERSLEQNCCSRVSGDHNDDSGKTEHLSTEKSIRPAQTSPSKATQGIAQSDSSSVELKPKSRDSSVRRMLNKADRRRLYRDDSVESSTSSRTSSSSSDSPRVYRRKRGEQESVEAPTTVVAHNPIARAKADQALFTEWRQAEQKRGHGSLTGDLDGGTGDNELAKVRHPDNFPVGRNPLTVERTNYPLVTAPSAANFVKSQDALWSDSSCMEDEEEESGSKKRGRKKGKSLGSVHSKKKKTSLENWDLQKEFTGLKPVFAYPLFGPWELEPLVLKVPEIPDNDFVPAHVVAIRQRCLSKTFQVPASIARYLGHYQQEGVQFMFRTMFKNGGGILGDDMGTGKTVQVISLLSALLEKTGTHEDALELKRRQKIAEEWKAKEEMAKDEALEHGHAYTAKQAAMPDHLPAWAPVLILAPSSILDNWMTDSATWGYFGISLYHSTDQYSGIVNIRSGASEILIVSHKLFEMESHYQLFNEIPWKLVVVDEHHKLKNPKAKLTKNLSALRDEHCLPVLGLTGTVNGSKMQNNHRELHCLIDLAAKGLVGDWQEFAVHFSHPIKLARAKDATPAIVELGAQRSNEFSALMYRAYLRRTKEEVLRSELPEKKERIVFCEMSELQKRIYEHMLGTPDFKLLRFSADPCDCGVNRPFFKFLKKLDTREQKLAFIRENKKMIRKRGKCCYKTPIISLEDRRIDPGAVIWKNQHENDRPCPEEPKVFTEDGKAAGPKCPYCILFAAMSRLMKLCSHVALLQPEASPEAVLPAQRKEAERDLEYAKAFIPADCLRELPGHSYVRANSMMNDHFKLSGKMKTLDRLLRGIEQRGGRVLIFSASTQTLDLIENYIKARGKSFLRMDGSTDRTRRKELADEFKENHGIFVFLLSTRAMGLGLNLTSANTVIIFDVEWNPSNDSQAQDRAYRLGQTSDVVVFRLVARGTIEELKYLRQVYKTQLKNETIVDVEEERRDVAARLFRGVAGDSSRQGELFGMANLLRFKDGTFMQYGDETRDSHRYGGDVYAVDTLVSAAQAAGEEALQAIVGDEEGIQDLVGEGVQDLVGLTENDIPACEMLGAESQNMFDFYDNEGEVVDNDFESDNSTVVEAGFVVPDTSKESVQSAGEATASEKVHSIPQRHGENLNISNPNVLPASAASSPRETGVGEGQVKQVRDPTILAAEDEVRHSSRGRSKSLKGSAIERKDIAESESFLPTDESYRFSPPLRDNLRRPVELAMDLKGNPEPASLVASQKTELSRPIVFGGQKTPHSSRSELRPSSSLALPPRPRSGGTPSIGTATDTTTKSRGTVNASVSIGGLQLPFGAVIKKRKKQQKG